MLRPVHGPRNAPKSKRRRLALGGKIRGLSSTGRFEFPPVLLRKLPALRKYTHTHTHTDTHTHTQTHALIIGLSRRNSQTPESKLAAARFEVLLPKVFILCFVVCKTSCLKAASSELPGSFAPTMSSLHDFVASKRKRDPDVLCMLNLVLAFSVGGSTAQCTAPSSGGSTQLADGLLGFTLQRTTSRLRPRVSRLAC